MEFKFLLAESGKKWDSTVEDVNFSVMRWGMQNISDFYIDNITFYDIEGNAIPLNPSEPEAGETDAADASDTETSEETVQESTSESESELQDTETEAIS